MPRSFSIPPENMRYENQRFSDFSGGIERDQSLIYSKKITPSRQLYVQS